MQQLQSLPPQQEQQVTTARVSSPPLTAPRPNRLLYRRGLPDLPELIEVEEDEVTTTDEFSTNTFSTPRSRCTSISSREIPPLTATSGGLKPQSLKEAVPSHTRQIQSCHEIYTQTPPGNVNQLQTPFDYIPSTTFRCNPGYREEASPPPSPTLRDEALANAGIEYGLGVSLAAPSGNCHVTDDGGMVDEYHESGMMASDVYGSDGCPLQDCPECFGLQTSSHHHSFDPYHRSSCSGGVNTSEFADYISPPSSPGTDCGDDQDGFYGLSIRSYPSFERPHSPSLLIDNDTFSSVQALPVLSSYTAQTGDESPDKARPSRGILGRRGTAVLNKVLPRSLRLKRWSSTPLLPKLQISSPPPLPRKGSISSPTHGPRTLGPPVPLNTAFDYDPYSDRLSDDEDDDETRRPTTRGTMMLREQLPTPPLLPTVAQPLPYIPQLDSPVSLSFPQSPSASVHNLGLSSQATIFPSLAQTVRTNSITSLSNQSLTSITPLTSPSYVSPRQRPLDVHSPVVTPPVATFNMSSLRGTSTLLQSPQLTHRQLFSPTAFEDVEDLVLKMELEDDAFEATEQRMASSGWSTETELGELRAKRQAVRREWEERIENARMKKRRGSDGGYSTHGSSLYGTMNLDSPATPVITLQATPNVSTTALLSTATQP